MLVIPLIGSTHIQAILDISAGPSSVSNPNGKFPSTMIVSSNGADSIALPKTTKGKLMTKSDRRLENNRSVINSPVTHTPQQNIPQLPVAESKSNSSMDTFYSAIWDRNQQLPLNPTIASKP